MPFFKIHYDWTITTHTVAEVSADKPVYNHHLGSLKHGHYKHVVIIQKHCK